MNEIWSYGENGKGLKEYKLYTEDEKIKVRLVGGRASEEVYKGWKGCRSCNIYYFEGEVVGWDIIFPKELKEKVQELIKA